MSKAIANPKIFAATCLLFAGATLFNVTANATSNVGPRTPEGVSVPVLEVGPTIPPSPWDDAPPVASKL